MAVVSIQLFRKEKKINNAKRIIYGEQLLTIFHKDITVQRPDYALCMHFES